MQFWFLPGTVIDCAVIGAFWAIVFLGAVAIFWCFA